MRMLRAAVPLLTLGLVLAACSAHTGGTPRPGAQAAAPGRCGEPPRPPRAPSRSTSRTRSSARSSPTAPGKTLYVFAVDGRRQVQLHRRLREELARADLRGRADARHRASTPRTSRPSPTRTQVTFYGHPLYYFAGDKAAGDTNGQGVGGKWFTVGADGNMMGATASPAASAAASPAAGGSTVALADTSLGSVLVGANGMTLYVFTADSASTSTCTGNCASNWPALTSATAPTVGTGLDAPASRRSRGRTRSPSTASRCTTSPATRPRATPTARASAASGTSSGPTAR